MNMEASKKEDLLRRLRRVEGQIRGIQKMVEDERYCGDVLNQFASVHQALRGASSILTRNHLETCVTDAIRSGEPAAAERTYDEIMQLLYRQIG
ncbi:MAG: metal-sensitive transcriptional regulator [Bacteroidota bacterium]